MTARAFPFEQSFLFQHALSALRGEPSWTVRMYCVYNDVDDATYDELLAALKRRGESDPSQALHATQLR